LEPFFITNSLQIILVQNNNNTRIEIIIINHGLTANVTRHNPTTKRFSNTPVAMLQDQILKLSYGQEKKSIVELCVAALAGFSLHVLEFKGLPFLESSKLIN
jgi:hypothetical protein